jgi:hypothetical protein
MNISDRPLSPPDSLFADLEQAWEQGRGYERASQLAAEHSEHGEALFDFLDALIQAELAPSPDPVASERSAAGLADRLDASGDASLAGAIREAAGLTPPTAEPSPHDPSHAPPPCEGGAVRGPARIVPFRSSDDGQGTVRRRQPARGADRAAALGSCFPVHAKERSGLNLKQLAEALRVPIRFLRGVDEHPNESPLEAIDELARRGEGVGLDFEESKTTLRAEPEADRGYATAASGQDGVRRTQTFSYKRLVEQCFKQEPDERALWLSFLT